MLGMVAIRLALTSQTLCAQYDMFGKSIGNCGDRHVTIVATKANGLVRRIAQVFPAYHAVVARGLAVILCLQFCPSARKLSDRCFVNELYL